MPVDTLPLVSVVIPCRNEEKAIGDCLHSLQAQTYPHDRLEILVADGRSTDGTRAIVAELARSVPGLRLVDNPARISPAAMNLAIRAASGSIIVLLGAHAELSPNYIAEAVQALQEKNVDCVGGLLETVSPTPGAEAIALAMASPFGVGDAKFRYSAREALVDTVAFGVYRREVFERLGYFNEHLPSNDDDEFNYRLRKLGGKILLYPAITARYYARASLKQLWRQYYGYGRGKVQVARLHAGMMRPRHAIPALFVAGLAGLAVASVMVPLARWGLIAYSGLYLAAAEVFSFSAARRYGWRYSVILPAVFLCLHASYGLGTWEGLLRVIGGGYDPKRA